MKTDTRKRVLIITYYWPPSGGAGVQRWLKFSKYMREFGYEPLIYTAEDPEYPSIDDSLVKDLPDSLTVLKTKVWEPYDLYKWFTGKKKGHRVNTGFLNLDDKKGFTEKISIWVRGNFFIPDARRFWIRPSIRFLMDYLGKNPVDLIATTGPPHSIHLIGMGLARRTGLPWVADFRDPWTKIDYYKDLMLTGWANRRHHKLELRVIKHASFVTVNSHDMKKDFNGLGVDTVKVIPNGFDPEDFEEPIDTESKSEVQLDEKFSLSHVGTITPSRFSPTLWKVLAELVVGNDEFARDLEIKLIGDCDYSTTQTIKELKLENWVYHTRYVPHNEAVDILKKSQVLILLIRNTPFAKGAQPAKLFEYMCAGRPILTVGPPDGETAFFLGETKTGSIIDFNDHKGLKDQILEYYKQYKKGKLEIQPDNINLYSRRNLTRSLTELFDQLLSSYGQ